MTVAIWQDVAIALGRPADSVSPETQAQITHWLNGIELLIKDRLGPVDLLDPEAVSFVETEAVAEKVRRGAAGGATSITTAVDDGSVTRRYEPAGISANDITDQWWSLLGVSRPRVRSIRLATYGEPG